MIDLRPSIVAEVEGTKWVLGTNRGTRKNGGRISDRREYRTGSLKLLGLDAPNPEPVRLVDLFMRR